MLLSAKFSQPISQNLYAEAEAQVGNMWLIPRSRERRGNPIPSGMAFGVRLGAKYYFSEEVAYHVSLNYLNGNVNTGDLRLGSTQNLSLALFNMGISYAW